MSSPETGEGQDERDRIAAALACIEELLQKSITSAQAGEDVALVPPELVQRVLELGTRLYAVEMQCGRSIPAFREHHGVSATDVMFTTTGMLKAVNIQLFELGMWQMWAKR
jgi:hypothetical protein